MTPLVHLVRHAQGFHNLEGGNYFIRDPSVTLEGLKQCEILRDSGLPDQSKISFILASPLCRALHSAAIIFGPALDSGSKCPPTILAVPDAQETSNDPCDIGRDPVDLSETVGLNRWPIDLSLVTFGWNDKSLDSRYSPSSDAIVARAKDTRLLIRQKALELVENGEEDVQIVLVTHGAYLHFFTNDWEDAELGNGGTGWQNCEVRSYQFEHDLNGDADPDAMLVETLESRNKRGKLHPMIGRDKQPELFEKAMEVWGSHGLQRPDKIGRA